MESESKIIKLFTEGEVKSKDKTFTRLVGGFGDNKPMFTIWQAGELLNLSTKAIKENYDNNINNFNKDIDYKDLKSALDKIDSEKIVDITQFLKNVGYSQNKLNATKQWLVFSFSGMMKLVKIATTKESWDIYNDFLEDYFKTKAENDFMKKSIEDEIKELNEDKKYYIGATVIEKDEIKKMEYQTKLENINNRITELEKTKSKKEVISQYEQEIGLAEKIYNSKSFYDMGRFAKILDTKGLGRNKLFEWLRNKKILRSNNEPYQAYMDYFKLIPIERNGYMDYKTTVKPLGIKYIVNKLNKDNKIVLKSVDDILKELEESENIGA